MVEVRLTVAAERDYRLARDWYRKKSQLTGQRFQAKIVDAIRHVVEQPLAWPELEEGQRFYRVERYPYIIVYRMIADEPLITGILHGKRSEKVRKRRKS